MTIEPADAAPCCHTDTSCPQTVTLELALQRFRSEAVAGVCDTGRYRCRYYQWGRGPRLLLIPGLSDDSLSFVMIAALLAEHFRCIAYDLPSGKGDGACLARYRHADLVEDVFALLDHLDAGPSYLLGSSFGSTVALAALHARPGRFPRAVLQGGFARRRLAAAEVLLASLARYWPGTMQRLPVRRTLLHRAHAEPFASCSPDVWEFFLARWGSPPIAAVARRALILHRLDLRPILQEIRQPVFLVSGDRDPLVDRTCEAELLRGLPNVAKIELSDCGHNPQFTHPALLAEVVRRFLTPAPPAV